MSYKRQMGRWRKIAVIFLLLLMVMVAGCSDNNKKNIIESVEQLNQSQYTISINTGSAAALLAEEMFPNAKIVYHDAISDAYLAVAQGKSDAFIFEKIFMQYAITSDSLDNLAIMEGTVSETDIAVGINPDREELLPEINAFIKQVRQDGTIDDMYNRWVVEANTTMPDIPKPENPDRVIKIGTSGLVEPMNYYDENQELTGFDLELIYRLAAYMNAEVKIEAMSFDALVASLETGKLDLVISDLNVTEERKEVILMSEPYFVSEIAVVVQKDRLANNGKQIADVGDLDGKALGMIEGCSFDNELKERFPNATLQYYPNYSDCIIAIKSGKIDSYITDAPLVKKQLASADGLTYFPELLTQEDYAFMMSKETDDLQQEINKVLEDLSKEGVIEELQKKWVDGDGTVTVDRDPNADTSKGTLNVITSADTEPFSYIANGELEGYEIELIVKIAERLGYKTEFQIANFSALIPAVKGGKADVAVGCITVTPERMEEVNFSDSIYTSGPMAVVLSGQENDKTFLDEIKDSFYRTFIKENRWKLIKDGMVITIQLSVISMILGTLLGFCASFLLRSKNFVIRQIAKAVSTFLDGMPLVVILMVLYYIVFKGVDISAVWVGIIGFTLDFANTVAGLLNTGITAVDKGQLEAASSMGYNKLQIFRKITFPQAAKQMFSQYEGAVVGLVKGTAIVGYITVEDLTKAGDIIRSRTYEAFFPLIVIAVLYFIIAYLFIAVLKRVDIHLDPKRRPRKVKGVQINDNN